MTSNTMKTDENFLDLPWLESMRGFQQIIQIIFLDFRMISNGAPDLAAFALWPAGPCCKFLACSRTCWTERDSSLHSCLHGLSLSINDFCCALYCVIVRDVLSIITVKM